MVFKNRFNESKVTPCYDWSGHSEGMVGFIVIMIRFILVPGSKAGKQQY